MADDVTACETLWVWDAVAVPDGVPEALRVTTCDPLDVTVGVPDAEGVSLPLGVKVSVRLWD